ncbi:MAG: FAD-binding oxidoreductase [Gammaproteobacteria bacterium]|nr:FAD-binding oxidoreductase [Gammaproteobacteria bacterium]
MNKKVFSGDYAGKPYWWERTPRPEIQDCPLPKSSDVVILGSGYTGLSAAIQTTRHNLQTVVIDAEDAGWGCSTRNGGQVSTSIKSSYPELCRQFGKDQALAIINTGKESVQWVEDFIQQNNIDCDYQNTGRFHGAHSPQEFQNMCRTLEETPEFLSKGIHTINIEQQRAEIGSNYYYGGTVNPGCSSIDPARYHQGMLNTAVTQGCQIITHCRGINIQKQNGVFHVSTTKGTIQARDVIVATNGYTGNPTPWMQRRIIPIGSYIIATEPLPGGMIGELLPTNRVITDTLKLVVYYRACPDQERILFGGRVSIRETDPAISAPKLRELMLDRFPSLTDIRITHSWMGFVAYTFDKLPHLGVHDGVHYCMGYCGSGISLSSYLGAKTGLRVAGQEGHDSPLDRHKFKGRFYYRGNPWFLKPSVFYFRIRDQLSSQNTRTQKT